MIQLHLLNLESPQVGKGYLQTTMTHYLLELNQRPRLLIDLNRSRMPKGVERLVFLYHSELEVKPPSTK